MALLKDIITPFGLTVAYWKITFLDFTYEQPGVQPRVGCVLRGWQSQADREQFKHISEMMFEWEGENVPSDRAEAYTAIKSQPAFVDATDI